MKMSDSLSFALLRIAAAWPSFAFCGVWVGLGERDGGTTSGGRVSRGCEASFSFPFSP